MSDAVVLARDGVPPEEREPAVAPIPGRPAVLDRIRAEWVPVAAVIRRDLTGTQRGVQAMIARTVAVLFSSTVVIVALAQASPWQANMFGAMGAGMMFGGLLLLALLFMPAIAVSAMRREREAGTLDLLLLAGVRPSALALGRVLSVWLFLESFLLASLPAISLFWFFRRPTLGELTVSAVALSVEFLVLAAIAVTISAWARNAGMAIALTVLALGFYALLAVFGMTVSAKTALMLNGSLPPSSWRGGSMLALLGFHVLRQVGWAALGVGIAARGVARRNFAAAGDKLLRKIEKRPLPLDDRRPMTWLLQRGSAAARPGPQAIGVAIVVAVGLCSPPEMHVSLGVTMAWIAFIVAMLVGATSIAPSREKRTWLPLIATSRSGPAIVGDMLGGALLASAPLMAGAAVLGLVGLARLDHASRASSPVVGTVMSVAATWLLVAVAGLVASLVARSTAGALALTAGILIIEPVLGLLVRHGLPESLHSGALDSGGTASWLALVLAAAGLGAWLVIRAGWRRASVIVAFAPTAGMLSLPLLLDWVDPTVWIVGACGAAAVLGLGLIVRGWRHEEGSVLAWGIAFVMGTCILPLVLSGLQEFGTAQAAFGGALPGGALAAATYSGSSEHVEGLVAGAFHHVLYAAVLAGAFWPKLERWLGRAG